MASWWKKFRLKNLFGNDDMQFAPLEPVFIASPAATSYKETRDSIMHSFPPAIQGVTDTSLKELKEKTAVRHVGPFSSHSTPPDARPSWRERLAASAAAFAARARGVVGALKVPTFSFPKLAFAGAGGHAERLEPTTPEQPSAPTENEQNPAQETPLGQANTIPMEEAPPPTDIDGTNSGLVVDDTPTGHGEHVNTTGYMPVVTPGAVHTPAEQAADKPSDSLKIPRNNGVDFDLGSNTSEPAKEEPSKKGRLSAAVAFARVAAGLDKQASPEQVKAARGVLTQAFKKATTNYGVNLAATAAFGAITALTPIWAAAAVGAGIAASGYIIKEKLLGEKGKPINKKQIAIHAVIGAIGMGGGSAFLTDLVPDFVQDFVTQHAKPVLKGGKNLLKDYVATPAKQMLANVTAWPGQALATAANGINGLVAWAKSFLPDERPVAVAQVPAAPAAPVVGPPSSAPPAVAETPAAPAPTPAADTPPAPAEKPDAPRRAPPRHDALPTRLAGAGSSLSEVDATRITQNILRDGDTLRDHVLTLTPPAVIEPPSVSPIKLIDLTGDQDAADALKGSGDLGIPDLVAEEQARKAADVAVHAPAAAPAPVAPATVLPEPVATTAPAAQIPLCPKDTVFDFKDASMDPEGGIAGIKTTGSDGSPLPKGECLIRLTAAASPPL